VNVLIVPVRSEINNDWSHHMVVIYMVVIYSFDIQWKLSTTYKHSYLLQYAVSYYKHFCWVVSIWLATWQYYVTGDRLLLW